MLWVLFAFATSTANAFMLTAMTIISHDFAARFVFNKIADEKERDVKVVRFSKNACIIVVFACIAVALMKLTYIIDYAYNLATPGFSQLIIPMIFGLYWRRASKEAAIASSVVGICVLIWAQIINPSPLGYHPILWSGAANVITFYLVTIFTKPPQEVVDAFFPTEDVVI
jgi:SSS family solute:Na+ symporter